MEPSQESPGRQDAGPVQDADDSVNEDLEATVVDTRLVPGGPDEYHDLVPRRAPRHDSDPFWASCSELAARYQVNAEQLRKRLSQLMREDDSAYREIANPGPREPRYLFKIEKVRPLIEAMKERRAESPDTRAGGET